MNKSKNAFRNGESQQKSAMRDKFYELHTSEITSCQAAKRYFDFLGLKKLPSMQSLKQEYATLQAENKKRYPKYKQLWEK